MKTYKELLEEKIKNTFNANGGKIGTAKTKAVSVTKGKKIGKQLPEASMMKRTGYTFKGWYTKKFGGVKVSKKTKISKKKTYYAQWNRKISKEEKKLTGMQWATTSTHSRVH